MVNRINGAVTYGRSGNIVLNDNIRQGTLVAVSKGVDTITRNSNPDYRVRIAKKLDATLSYSRSDFEYKQPLMFSSARRIDGGTPKFTSAVTAAPVVQSTLSIPATHTLVVAADDIALKRLKKRLADNQDAFKALVPLAEVRETYRLASSMVSATNDLLRSLLELKHGRPRSLVSAASKAWLTFSFGVSPTISDMNAAINAIGSYLLRADYVNKVYGRAETSWAATAGVESTTAACNGHVYNTSKRMQSHSYQVQYTAGVRMDLKSSNSYGISEHFGLTFGDIVPTLWELTVFSWVVDYFSTIGDYLEDVFVSDAGNTVYCCKSVKYEVIEEASFVLTNQSPVSYQTTSLKNAYTEQFKSFHFKRSALAAIPHRAFRFKTIDEVGINSVNRLLNLASILLR